jgi:hypothetical protein
MLVAVTEAYEGMLRAVSPEAEELEEPSPREGEEEVREEDMAGTVRG